MRDRKIEPQTKRFPGRHPLLGLIAIAAMAVAACSQTNERSTAQATLHETGCSFQPPSDVVGTYSNDESTKAVILDTDGQFGDLKLSSSTPTGWRACFGPPPGPPNTMARSYLVDGVKPIVFNVRNETLTLVSSGERLHRVSAAVFFKSLPEAQRLVVSLGLSIH